MSNRFSESIFLAAVSVMMLAGCPPPPVAPPPLLIADPPPNEDGRMPGAGMSDFDRGMAYVKNEAYAEAIPYLNRALAAQPNNAQAQYYRGLCYDQAGNRAEAERGYKRALELDANLVEARVNLGAIYLEEPARPKKAVAVLAEAAKLDPGAQDVHRNLALAYQLVADFRNSATHYETALKLKDDGELRFAYANMLFEAGKLKESSVQMRKVLPALKDDPKALLVLAQRFAKAKAWKDCVEAFDAAIKLDSKQSKYFVQRGLCKHSLKEESAARGDYLAAIKLNSSFQAAYYYLAMSYRQDKQRTKAANAFEKTVKLGRQTAYGKKAKKKLKEMAAENAGR